MGSIDSEFFQRGVKGRGSERKPNDLVVSLDEQIARIKPDGDHWARVDRHGLWVKIREVKGATSRPIRHSLETESKVHLRREQNCPLELMPTPGIHCKTYAVVDANGLVDLGAYAGWSTRRLVVLFGRCLRRLLSGLHALIYYGSGFFLLKRAWKRPAPARVIREGTNVRALDPDSESEMETLEDPCEAVLIGLEVGGRPRALAVDPCADKATGEGVRLLERDRELSDISNRCTARLCDHHRQLYIAACSGRKCSVLSCHEQVDGAKQGVPLCRKHLMEIGSSARPTRRISWSEGPDDSTPRTPHRDSDVVHQSPKGEQLDKPPVRPPRSKSQERGIPNRARAASAGPQSSQQHQLEGSLQQGSVLVLLRFRSCQKPGGPPRWVAYFGSLQGVSADSRVQEKVDVFMPGLGLTGVVHASALQAAPAEDASGRFSRQ